MSGFRSLVRWATQNLYSSGPKTGAPTKVHPDAAMRLQGIRPGVATRADGAISAEEMNELLALATSEIVFRRFTPFMRWTQVNTEGTHVAAVHDYGFGREFYVPRQAAATPSDLRKITMLGANEEIEAPSAIWSDVSTRVRGCRRKISSTLAGVVFFGVQANGARARFNTARETWASADLNSSPTGAWPCMGCAHDAVNGYTVALLASGNERAFVRLADGAAPSLVRASSAPAVAGVTEQNAGSVICAGGGRAIALFRESTAFQACTSIDGGDTWTAIAVPRSGGSTIRSCAFVEDFLGLGPRFVFTGESSSSALDEIYHTADGSAWETIVIPSPLGGKQCAILGDVLIVESLNNLYGYDIRSGAVVALADFGALSTNQVVDSGSRIYVALDDGTTIMSEPYALDEQTALGALV